MSLPPSLHFPHFAVAVPQYADLQTRLGSFRDWERMQCPNTATVNPRALAEAGFYHHPFPHEPDRCVCFYCGEALCGWDPNDIPTQEHKRFRKHCAFLKRLCRQDAQKRQDAVKMKSEVCGKPVLWQLSSSHTCDFDPEAAAAQCAHVVSLQGDRSPLADRTGVGWWSSPEDPPRAGFGCVGIRGCGRGGAGQKVTTNERTPASGVSGWLVAAALWMGSFPRTRGV